MVRITDDERKLFESARAQIAEAQAREVERREKERRETERRAALDAEEARQAIDDAAYVLGWVRTAREQGLLAGIGRTTIFRAGWMSVLLDEDGTITLRHVYKNFGGIAQRLASPGSVLEQPFMATAVIALRKAIEEGRIGVFASRSTR